MILKLADLDSKDRYHYLQHAIAPRPIALASTVDAAGNVNLSPFSYFNIFSAYPPIVVFSPSRRARDKSNKHTLENVEEVKEVVINIVDHDMVQQMSLSSCEYAKGVDEFAKAGFTAVPAIMVKPPLVKESKFSFECKVLEIKSLGTEGGAGNLVIAEILVMHIDESVLDENKKIIQEKTNQVARLGGDWYCRVTPENLFVVPKPSMEIGMGMDALPASIRNSHVFSGNDLGMLANLPVVPVIDASFDDEKLRNIIQYHSLDTEQFEIELQQYAKSLLQENKVQEAWQVLLSMVV